MKSNKSIIRYTHILVIAALFIISIVFSSCMVSMEYNVPAAVEASLIEAVTWESLSPEQRQLLLIQREERRLKHQQIQQNGGFDPDQINEALTISAAQAEQEKAFADLEASRRRDGFSRTDMSQAFKKSIEDKQKKSAQESKRAYAAVVERALSQHPVPSAPPAPSSAAAQPLQAPSGAPRFPEPSAPPAPLSPEEIRVAALKPATPAVPASVLAIPAAPSSAAAAAPAVPQEPKFSLDYYLDLLAKF